MSPKNKEIAIIMLIKTEKLFRNKNITDIRKEDIVPDQVLLGLIFLIILGPPINLPNMYAEVSLINDNKIKI